MASLTYWGFRLDGGEGAVAGPGRNPVPASRGFRESHWRRGRKGEPRSAAWAARVGPAAAGGEQERLLVA